MSVHDETASGHHAFQGTVFKELPLPVPSGTESGIFRGDEFLSGSWIAAAALTGFSLREGEKILFELYGSNSRRGPFYRLAEISSRKGPATFSAGTEILRYVPGSETKRFLKLKIPENRNLPPSVITVYLARKG